MAENKKNIKASEEEVLIPDFTDAEVAKQAFIASEIFNRKY